MAIDEARNGEPKVVLGRAGPEKGGLNKFISEVSNIKSYRSSDIVKQEKMLKGIPQTSATYIDLPHTS